MIATEHEQNSELGLAPLITGIINDAQVLIQQQLTLFHDEIRKDLDRRKDAAIPFAIGLVVGLLASIFLCLCAAHLLLAIWPQLPLYAAYGIVGLVLAGVGGTFLLVGKTKFEVLHPIAEKSVEALKENVQWTTKT